MDLITEISVDPLLQCILNMTRSANVSIRYNFFVHVLSQKLTSPKQTQAKMGLIASLKYLSQQWSAPFYQPFSQKYELRERCIPIWLQL